MDAAVNDKAAEAPKVAGQKKGRKQRKNGAAATGRGVFESFYRDNLLQPGLLDEEEFQLLLQRFEAPLPTTFWLTPTSADFSEVLAFLEQAQHTAQDAKAEEIAEGAALQGPLRVEPLKWARHGMAWCVDVPRVILRKDPAFKELHQLLLRHTAYGTINRQEEVSMLPVVLLDIQAGHRCLDMCAAPGSKTAQMLVALAEANLQRWGPGHAQQATSHLRLSSKSRLDYTSDEGLVVANEMSTQRSCMLVHQIARHRSLYPLAVFTSHDARFFPTVRRASGEELGYDRILCDVMCSGDGTLRKAPHLWRSWSPTSGQELHCMQLAVALRAARLLKVGGRFVYSTCSLSPLENEAVVAELLRCTSGSVRLLDSHEAIQPFRRMPGLKRWLVPHPATQQLYSTYEDAVASDGVDNRLMRSHFPPDHQDVLDQLGSCLRILPHHNDTGGFFIAVFEKVASVQAPADEARSYDSDVDADGEEEERRSQLERLEAAVANGASEQERIKAAASRERLRKAGTLAREIARYRAAPEVMPEALACLAETYGVRPELPREQLICRYHVDVNECGAEIQAAEGATNQLLYCARAVADFLRAGTGDHAKRRVKVVAGGLRAFEKDRFEVPAKASQYRLAQEAVEILLPYCRERVVTLSQAEDAERLLLGGKNAPLEALVSPEKEALRGLSPGGCVLLLATRCGSGKFVAVSALRTRQAVNLYVDDNDLSVVQAACGLKTETAVVEEESPSGAQPEAGASSAAKKLE